MKMNGFEVRDDEFKVIKKYLIERIHFFPVKSELISTILYWLEISHFPENSGHQNILRKVAEQEYFCLKRLMPSWVTLETFEELEKEAKELAEDAMIPFSTRIKKIDF